MLIYSSRQPFKKPFKLQGRNEKCYCKSGLKFKNCCGLAISNFEAKAITGQGEHVKSEGFEKGASL